MIQFQEYPTQPSCVALRFSVSVLAVAILLFAAGAPAQSIPEANGPKCVPSSINDCSGYNGSSGSSSSSTFNPAQVWKQRFHNMAEANKRRKAEATARKKAEEDAKAKKIQDGIDELYRRGEAYRQLQLEAEKQKQETLEAERRQSAFDALKPGAVVSLKGIDNAGSDLTLPVYASLKGLDSGAAVASEPAWTKTITDPQVAPIAHKLAKVVPPLPISAKEVDLDWKKIYLNDDRLMNTLDMVVAGWEMTGVLGESISVPCKMLLIGGKTFIAGEDGAYAFLVKKDADYDAALAYLKDPAKAKEFSHLVQQLRQNQQPAKTADLAMLRAARAVANPKLGDTASMVWDAMTSKEALTAMVRKAALEASSELAPSTEGLLKTEAERKATFDAIRLERKQAKIMLERTTVSAAQKEQLKTVIQQADRLSAETYAVDKIERGLSSQLDDKISDAWDQASEKIADHFLGEEPEGRTY